MGSQRLDQGLRDGSNRVERAVGVLEDRLNVTCEGAPPGCRGIGDVLSFKEDRALGGRDQAQDGVSQGRLPRAALSDNGHGLAGSDRQADIPEGHERRPTTADPVADRKAVNFQTKGGACHHATSSSEWIQRVRRPAAGAVTGITPAPHSAVA